MDTSGPAFSASKTASEQALSELIAAAEEPVALMQADRRSSKAFAAVVQSSVAAVDDLCELLREIPPKDGVFNVEHATREMQERPQLLKFANVALPVIVECALRRKCPREYAPLVAKFACRTSALLAQMLPYDRLFPFAMQLLYVLFDCAYAAGSFVRVATPLPPGAAASPTSSSGGQAPMPLIVFYNQHGRPNVMYRDGLPVYFWPDEEDRLLGGEKAVGHHVCYYDPSIEDWVEGDVVQYAEEDGKHAVQLTPPATSQDQRADEVPASRQVRISLKELQHFWCDRRFAGGSALQNGNGGDDGGLALTFSEQDIGTVVKIYWPYYNRYYRGRVSDYFPDQQKHVITYDDGDVRTYDMNRKQYEVVSLPGQDAAKAKGAVQPATATQTSSSTSTSNNGSGAPIANAAERDAPQQLAVRPPASSGFWISEHLVAVINTFAAEGGFNRIFLRLVDVSQPPPSSSFIATYLRILAQLRPKVQTPAFKQCVWEAKEAVPGAMLRFTDQHLKDLTQDRLTDMLDNLHDLIAVAEGSGTTVSTQETINRLHLQVALKMLRCSQLQKRVQALTHIRWIIETIAPGVMNYVRNRPMRPLDPRPAGRTAANVAAQFDRRKQVVLTTQFMQDWLVENQVVELLFGESMHTELIPRCDVILLFLALRGALQQRQLAQIWRSCVDSHEAVARVVHPLILDLARTLSPGLRLFLFGEIAALPFAKYSEQTLRLIKDYTVIALSVSRREAASGTARSDGIIHPQVAADIGRDALDSSSAKKGQVVNLPQKQWLGFGLLWQFIQDPVAPQASGTVGAGSGAGAPPTSQAASSSSSGGGSGSQDSAASSYVSHALIDVAVDLMVELLAEEEFRDEREMLIDRCLDNVANHRSVPASLMLLRKSIASIPTNQRSWFGGRKGSATPQSVVESLQKGSNLLGVFFADLQFYHQAFMGTNQAASTPTDRLYFDFTQPAAEAQLLNERRIRINGASSRHPHVRQVQERLEFLTFVLSTSSLNLTEEQALLLWTCGVERAATAETAVAVLTWFDQALTADDKQLRKFLDSVQYTMALSTAAQKALLGAGGAALPNLGDGKLFASGVLANVFESHIVKYAKHVVSTASARLCVKLFLHTALANKWIRVEDDGVWSVQQMIPPESIDILWRNAVEAEDEAIAEAIMALLVELHHRISPKLQQRATDIRGMFIQRCLRKLSLNIQSLKGDAVPDTDERTSEDMQHAASATAAAATVTSPTQGAAPVRTELTARRLTRYVRLIQQFVHRFGDDPNQRVLVQLKVARDGPVIAELKLKVSDTVSTLRRAATEYFADSPDAIVLLRSVQSRIGMGSQELLAHDEKTLREEKFGVCTTVLVRKKEQNPSNGTKPAAGAAPEQAALLKAKPELIQPTDLTKGFNEATRMLNWLAMEDAVAESADGTVDDMSFFLRAVAAAPAAPLPHKPDMVLDPKSSQAGGSSESKADTEFRRLVEAVGPYLASKPELFDQLFSMLDGALSTEIQGIAGFDVSAAVWEVMQRFPTQATLLEQLRALALPEGGQGHFRQLFDTASLYKLVYSLQIIDTFLTSRRNQNSPAVRAWASRFMYLGGCEHLVNAFRTQLSTLAEYMPRDHQPSTTESSRFEIYVLSLTLLARILHSFLLFDSMYADQQPQQVLPSLYGSESPQRAATTGGAAPTPSSVDGQNSIGPGVMLALVDVDFLLQDGIQVMLTMGSASAAISQTVFGSFVEHMSILMTGCVNAVDDGWTRLASHRQWGKWVRTFCVRHPSMAVRGAACRRLFVAACCQRARGDGSSMFLLQSILCACHPDLASKLGMEAPVSRVTSTTSLSELGQTPTHSGAAAHDESKFTEDHLAASTSAAGGSRKQLRDGEQAYSLVALLVGMRLFPEFVLKGGSGAGANETDDGELLLFAQSRFTLDDLCEFFVGLLMTHKATESLHALEPDSTLVGLFRVLLILMRGSSRRQKLISTGKRDADDSAPPRVMLFVYYKCLFPVSSDADAALELAAATASGAQNDATSMQHGALCKTRQTRFLAYAMLFEFVNSNEANFMQLVTEMLQWSKRFGSYSGRLLEDRPVDDDTSPTAEDKHRLALKTATERARLQWEYDPYSLMKDAGDYVGLVNQGATCYMNSTLQQLFHTSSFRNYLLGIEDQSASLSDSVLFQLQVLFGHLKTTQKRFYDTLPLCRAFTDYDGQPISLAEQKDANEFCSMLFDKLETADPKANELVKKNFGGMFSWQVVSTESSYRSERLEPFYVITADVKGKRSLEESLELLVSSELLTGDNKVLDPDLEKKVEATRRCAIQELPDTLIIHLKRFQFDVETLTRTKVNDYCSFPLELDMLPYTVEGLAYREMRLRSMSRAQVLDTRDGEGGGGGGGKTDSEDGGSLADQVNVDIKEEVEHAEDDEEGAGEEKTGGSAERAPHRPVIRPHSYYEYELTGIVAHFGTAESGHYYSFIKDKERGRWLEFNDRLVVPFSEDQIEAECFGGTEKVTTNIGTVSREKMNSAYLLFYSRVEPYTTADLAPPEPNTNLSPVRTLSEDVDAEDHTAHPAGGAGLAISKQVLHAVWNENVDFLRDLHLFDKVHFRFMLNLMTAPVLFGVDLSTQATADAQASIESHALETWKGSARAVPTTASVATQQRIAMLSLQFAVEILTRARAGSCVPIWFDQLEQMVLADASGEVAQAILDELAVMRLPAARPRDETRRPPSQTPPEPVVHPWLRQIFVHCPSSTAVRHMQKLLLACVHTARPDAHRRVLRKFLDSMLTLLETYKLVEAPIRAGLEAVGELLYKTASTSFALRMMLIDLGAVDRMVAAWLRLRGADLSGNIVNEMVHLVDAVCMFVRSLQVAPGEEYESELARQMPTVQPSAPSGARLSTTMLTDETGQPSSEILLPRDLFAFFNRVFVEDAILAASQSFAVAACHLVQGLGVCNTTLQFCGQLAEKAIDCTTVKGYTATGYRSYMRVLTELLMSQAASGDGVLFMEQCVPQLLDRAERLANRQAKNDAEFVYSVSKLMLRFGMTSPDAFASIQGMMKRVQQVRTTFVREAARQSHSKA